MIFVKYYTSNANIPTVTVKEFGSPISYLYEYNRANQRYERLAICKHPRELNHLLGKLGIAISEPNTTERLEGDISGYTQYNVCRMENYQEYPIL